VWSNEHLGSRYVQPPSGHASFHLRQDMNYARFQHKVKTFFVWELVNHGASWQFAILRYRNTLLTYKLANMESAFGNWPPNMQRQRIRIQHLARRSMRHGRQQRAESKNINYFDAFEAWKNAFYGLKIWFGHAGWSKKLTTSWTPYYFVNYWPISNLFTDIIKRTFLIIPPLKIPPHLKCVVTLPCEMSVS